MCVRREWRYCSTICSQQAQASKVLHTICLLCLHWKHPKARSSSSLVRCNTINIIKLLKKYHMRAWELFNQGAEWWKQLLAIISGMVFRIGFSLLTWFPVFLTCYYWYQIQSGKNMDPYVSWTNHNFLSLGRTKTISMKLDCSAEMSSQYSGSKGFHHLVLRDNSVKSAPHRVQHLC